MKHKHRIFSFLYLMTAGTSNTPRSKNYILVYDISDYPENKSERKPLASESIYMTSSTYHYFMELESVTIRNGIMYFATNSGKSEYYEGYDFVGKLNTTFAMTPEYTAAYTGDPTALPLRVTYANTQGETVTTTLTDPTLYGTQYTFDFDGLLAAELRSTVSVAVYEGNTRVSPTLEYSASSYGNNKPADLQTVCKALMAYSDAAKAYFTAE